MNFRSCCGGLRKTDGDQILGSNTTLSVSFKSHQWMSRVWSSFLHYPVFKISTLSTICVLPVKTVGVFDSGAVLLKSCKGFFFFFLNNEEKMCSEVYFRTAETSWQLSHCNVTVFFFNWKEFCLYQKHGRLLISPAHCGSIEAFLWLQQIQSSGWNRSLLWDFGEDISISNLQ